MSLQPFECRDSDFSYFFDCYLVDSRCQLSMLTLMQSSDCRIVDVSLGLSDSRRPRDCRTPTTSFPLVVGFSTPCDCRTPTTSFSWLAHYVLVSHCQCWCLLYFLDCLSYLEFNFFPDCQICNRSSASLGETKESPPAESDGSIVLPASSCLDHLEGGHRHSQRYRPLPAPEEFQL
jgi:hypothetical protein